MRISQIGGDARVRSASIPVRQVKQGQGGGCNEHEDCRNEHHLDVQHLSAPTVHTFKIDHKYAMFRVTKFSFQNR